MSQVYIGEASTLILQVQILDGSGQQRVRAHAKEDEQVPIFNNKALVLAALPVEVRELVFVWLYFSWGATNAIAVYDFSRFQ